MKDLKDYLLNETRYDWDDICYRVEEYLQSIKKIPMKFEDINKVIKDITYSEAQLDVKNNELYFGWNCNNNAEGDDTLVTVTLQAPCSENNIVVLDWEIE